MVLRAFIEMNGIDKKSLLINFTKNSTNLLKSTTNVPKFQQSYGVNQMHIPDGVIPLHHAIFYIVVSLILIAIAIWQSRRTITSKQLIVVGVLGAGIFAAQMFNFPVPYGSSGHLIGTALATVLVGPWVGMLILTAILFIQSFFGDGGLLALGANVFNMAVIGAFSTVLLFLLIPKRWRKNRYAFAGFSAAAAFISTILMSLTASTELSIAQVGPPKLIFGWMLGLHAIIGLIEAAITFTVVSFVFVADPSLFHLAEESLFMHSHTPSTPTETPHFKFPVWGLVVTLIILSGISLFGIIASENPDGLERTFEALYEAGFIVNINETGLFGLPEGLGWAILQLALIMTALFGGVVISSYLAYVIKKRKHIIHQQVETPTTMTNEQNRTTK